LIRVEPLGTAAELMALQRLEQKVQALDAGVGVRLGGAQTLGLRPQDERLGARSHEHRLQRLDVIRQITRSQGHARSEP
jgi:hypothetical protein